MIKNNKEYVDLMSTVIKANGTMSIRDIVPNKKLEPVQELAVVHSLIRKRTIISLDTGLGKTVVASALINLILKDSEKALFILKRGTLDELFLKLGDNLQPRLKIGFITSEQKVKNYNLDKNKLALANVIVVSSDALRDHDVNDYIYQIRNSIKIVIVDEIHLFANLESLESRFIELISRNSEYCFLLSATPFQRDIQQLINAIYVLDKDFTRGKPPQRFGNLFREYENGLCIGYQNLELLKKMVKPYIFNMPRNKLGIKNCNITTINWVKPRTEWLTLKNFEAMHKIVDDTLGNNYFMLFRLVFERISKGMKGIIYANHNTTKKLIYNKLTDSGYRVAVVDGTISDKKKRLDTCMRFNEGEYDVLITNIPTSLDLDCDFLIFYELTFEYIQMCGRGNRSFFEKDFYIDFIIAKGTYQERYYKNNVLIKVKLLGEIMERDVSDLVEAKENIDGKIFS